MEKPVTVDGPTTRKMLALAEEADEEEPEGRRRPDVPPLQGPRRTARPHPGRRDRRHHRPARLPHARPGRLGVLRPQARRTINELLYQIQPLPQLPVGQRRLLQRLLHPQHRRMLLDEERLAGQGPGHRRPPLPRRQRRPELRHLLGRVHVRRRHQAVPRTAAPCPAATTSSPATPTAPRGSASSPRPATRPAKCRIYKGQKMDKDNLVWAFRQPEPNPYQLEWERPDRRDPQRQAVQRSQARRRRPASSPRWAAWPPTPARSSPSTRCSTASTSSPPTVDKLTLDGPAPLKADADGKYPIPLPGINTSREYA